MSRGADVMMVRELRRVRQENKTTEGVEVCETGGVEQGWTSEVVECGTGLDEEREKGVKMPREAED